MKREYKELVRHEGTRKGIWRQVKKQENARERTMCMSFLFGFAGRLSRSPHGLSAPSQKLSWMTETLGFSRS